jgi:hypothetical protein
MIRVENWAKQIRSDQKPGLFSTVAIKAQDHVYYFEPLLNSVSLIPTQL